MQTEAQKIAQIAQSGDFETAYQLCLATGIDFCTLPVNFADMLENGRFNFNIKLIHSSVQISVIRGRGAYCDQNSFEVGVSMVQETETLPHFTQCLEVGYQKIFGEVTEDECTGDAFLVIYGYVPAEGIFKLIKNYIN